MGKNNIVRTILTQTGGVLTDKAVGDLIAMYDFPAGLTVKVVQAVLRGAYQGVMLNVFDDVDNRQLSTKEIEKHNRVFNVAERVFMEQAVNDGIDQMVIVMDESQAKYAYEVAEHLSLEAIRQSQEKKIDILGQYYGKRFYQGPGDWQDMHQIISMASTLSWRQIVLIRLISDGFKSISPEMYITKSSACVEINRMRDYGLWMTDMVLYKNDASARLQVKMLKPTDYTHSVCDALMLERISEEDIMIIIDSLNLSDRGEPAEGITKEDFEANTGFYYEEGSEGLTVGRKRSSLKDVATSPEDMAHVLKGKDLMKEATDNAHSGEYMQSIDCIMNALVEFKQCKADVLYQSSIDDALKELISFFELCLDKGGLRVLEGKKKDYEEVLGELRSEHQVKCQDFLRKSEEKDKGYDRELYDKEIDAIINN